MGEFLCLCGLGEENGAVIFRAGDTYEGYFDDDGDLRIEDEQGNENCFSEEGWRNWFKEV